MVQQDPTLRARLALVQQIAKTEPYRGSGRWQRQVLAALAQVPRHAFVDGVTTEEAYADTPLPIGYGQTISQPTVVAIMTHLLDVQPGQRILEVGTGSGYQAAVLAHLGAEVSSIEVVEPLAREVTRRLDALGYSVAVRWGDGYAGWPERAPFDRILLAAAPPVLPIALLDQLVDRGRLVAPLGDDGGVQGLFRFEKQGKTLRTERICSVRFVPMIPMPR